MAVKTIPDLPSKSTLANTDLLVADDGEHSYKITWQAFQALLATITNFQALQDGSLKITLANGATPLTAKPSDPLKQDKLTFDDTPTQNSNNPVKSGGIYTALGLKLNSADYKLYTGATASAQGTEGIVPAPGNPDTYLGGAGSWEIPDSTPTANSKKLITSGGVKAALENYVDIQANCGFHNSIYRGKNLGTSVTAEQWAAISAGTFTDMYVGDYWVINSVTWRIAHFDYWLNTGDTNCTTHHVVIVPDTNLYNAQMNTENVTTGGYYNSKMRGGASYLVSGSSNLYNAKVAIDNAFGSAHILSHRELLTNGVSNGNASGWAWYDSTVDLMSEVMVYGTLAWSVGGKGYEVGIDKEQLALFRLDHSRICNRAYWWLRGVYSATSFANVSYYGNAFYYSASNSVGVRPAFAIK